MPHFAVDRIEGQVAVLIGEDGSKHDIPLTQLPAGTDERSVLDVDVGADGKPSWGGSRLDAAEMKRRIKRGKERLEAWKKRGPGRKPAP